MLKLYNTLSRKKDDFEPLNPKKVLVYQCGPTVYWTQHIGNMRAMVFADILARTLKYGLGYDVSFARNYTDVGHLTSDTDTGEDKMEKGAKREGKTPEELANKYINIFEEDVAALNTLPPEYKPRATDRENIESMINMVRTLIDKKFAYVTKLAVYFDVSKVSDYTKLSRQKIEFNIGEAGHGNVADPNKKNPADFALWFFKAGVHKNALQTWNSEKLGSKEGFPGWHIECSAMIKRLLGDTIDIHLGGIEHIPVHHTNEIAQSESANEKPLARFWMHYEHLLVDGKKMSKSEGTGYSLEDIKKTVTGNKEYRIDTEDKFGRTEEWSHLAYDLPNFIPLSLRYLFLNSHYRSKQNFTFEALRDAQMGYFRMIKKVSEITEKRSKKDAEKPYIKMFEDGINDDLNTAEAISAAWRIVTDPFIETNKKNISVDGMDKILGLELRKMSEIFRELKKQEEYNAIQKISELVKERNEAKKNKDYAKADKIRDEIKKRGYSLKDTAEGETEIVSA